MNASRTATTAWRTITRHVRKEGRAHNTPCHLCHGARVPIDYRTQSEADRDARAAGKYWDIGQARPLALDVDHITPPRTRRGRHPRKFGPIARDL
ncbi:hypothetical protein GCM10009588_31070 [Microbacterium phyllosphaerae]